MQYVVSLLDAAAKVCGSYYKLSKRTGYAESAFSAIRKGTRRVPLEWVPVLADVAGVDPVLALALAMHEQLPEESEARRVLGGFLELGGLGVLRFSDAAGAGYAEGVLNKLYIVSIGVVVSALQRMSVFRARITGFGSLLPRPRLLSLEC